MANTAVFFLATIVVVAALVDGLAIGSSSVENGDRCSPSTVCSSGYKCCSSTTCCKTTQQCCGSGGMFCCSTFTFLATPAVAVEPIDLN
uniref:Cysteine rich secreted protein n=1 Tax=Riptortus pedestris TaxID=329032 RepID=R4WCY8_RIPPE|nr:cysteine rich secreted protein [Riptortus pedestris]